MPAKIQRPDHVPDLWRLKSLYTLVLIMMGVIVARLWYLQIAMGASFAQDAEKQRTRPIRRIAARGVIMDAKGRVLATNRSEYVVSLLPEEIRKNPQALPALARILDVTPESLQQKLGFNKRATEPVNVAEKVDLRVLTQIEEQKLDLDGVDVSKDPVRYYTDNKLCTHILGITRPINPDKLDELSDQGYHQNDMIGVDGLERTYEDQLRGTDGTLLVAVDAKNRMLRHLKEMPPVPGNTLQLSVDLDLQRTAYEALQDTLARGHPGSAVALDPNTGAVLAMVSTPSYDLNDYGKKYNQLRKDPLHALINRASGSKYPCGSTFKLVTASAGLETGAIGQGSYEYCPGYFYLGKKRFGCDGVHGSIPFETALGKSCDVYFYHVGRQVGQKNLETWARRFGLGERTGVDLPGETRGTVPTPEWKLKTKRGPWVPGDLVNMSIGQGYVGVSPLQLADYTAALANGGTLWRPQLVREIRDASGNVVHRLTPEARGQLGLRPENRAAILRGMERVVQSGGTAPNVAIPGLEIAGKTGTAQTGKGGDNSVFVCFAPVDHPRIAIAVLIEKAGHGSDFAAPVARQLLCRYFHIKQTAPVARGGAD